MTPEEFVERYKREHPESSPADILELAFNPDNTQKTIDFCIKASDIMGDPLFREGIMKSRAGTKKNEYKKFPLTKPESCDIVAV
jgi:hypothetical protein